MATIPHMPKPIRLPPWPYPFWIAHRGAGHLAPENTLAALRAGARHGYRMFECDAKLSADGVPFLMHDAELDRTTNGTGIGGDQPWGALAQLDAGGWHSPGYAGEPLATLAAAATFCRANGLHLDIEIKPTPGLEEPTGAAVAEHVARWWQDAKTLPLLTSFQPASLRAAQRAAPQLPRGLLLDAARQDWLDLAHGLGCVAVVCNHRLWNTKTVAAAHGAGLRALSYTVDACAEARRLMDLDTDGIITNAVDRFHPDSAA